MLEAIAKEDMPMQGGRERGEVARFAEVTLDEFEASRCDLAEVTGWPQGATAVQVRAAIWDAMHRKGMRGRVRVMRRGDRLFLGRIGR